MGLVTRPGLKAVAVRSKEGAEAAEPHAPAMHLPGSTTPHKPVDLTAAAKRATSSGRPGLHRCSTNFQGMDLALFGDILHFCRHRLAPAFDYGLFCGWLLPALHRLCNKCITQGVIPSCDSALNTLVINRCPSQTFTSSRPGHPGHACGLAAHCVCLAGAGVQSTLHSSLNLISSAPHVHPDVPVDGIPAAVSPFASFQGAPFDGAAGSRREGGWEGYHSDESDEGECISSRSGSLRVSCNLPPPPTRLSLVSIKAPVWGALHAVRALFLALRRWSVCCTQHHLLAWQLRGSFTRPPGTFISMRHPSVLHSVMPDKPHFST